MSVPVSTGLNEVDSGVQYEALGGSLANVPCCRKRDGGTDPVTGQWIPRDPHHHDKFIYAGDLGLSHVEAWLGPERMGKLNEDEKKEIVGIIKDMANLVVKIYVPFISLGRPKDDYLFSNKRGKWAGAVGTGKVHYVIESKDGHWNEHITYDGTPLTQSCPQYCSSGTATSDKCWKIGISTARHVLFDNDEAKKSQFIFFDEQVGGSGAVVSGVRVDVKTETGALVTDSRTEEDSCDMNVYTHDEGLATALAGVCDRWRFKTSMMNYLCDLVCGDKVDDDGSMEYTYDTDIESYRMKDYDVDINKDKKKLKVVVIGHGHGRTKQISLGEVVAYRQGKWGSGLTYRAVSCPGTSGGWVFPTGTHRIGRGNKGIWQYTHSRATDREVGVSADYAYY